MTDIEQLKQQLQQQEKLASLGMLSAGIAHEIQNPLNFVINFSKMSDKLLRDLTEIIDDNADKLSDDDREDVADIMSDLHDNMAKIVEHGERAINIIRDILLVSRGKEDEFLPSDVNRLVHEYVWLSYHAMRAKDKTFNITIHENLQDGLPLMMVIPQDLSRAVLNLMNNACYAVHHNGEGMSDDVKARLFENFFTTKPIGKGTGLGMSITRDIIEQKHHGRLTFESTLNQGTTFTITIPVRKS